MMTFILVIHSITCVLLVLTILMQAGRGGGLTEQFASAESVFGAQTSSFMVRLTTVLVCIFFVTSLTLALMSARQERSLMASSATAPKTQKSPDLNIPAEPVQETAQSAAAALPSEDSTDSALPQTPVVTNTQK